jgi:RHS repeat-associated protein
MNPFSKHALSKINPLTFKENEACDSGGPTVGSLAIGFGPTPFAPFIHRFFEISIPRSELGNSPQLGLNIDPNENQFLKLTFSFSSPIELYKSDGCLCCQSSPAVADPIRLAIGNLFEEVTDFATAGINPLEFSRSYNSVADTNSVAVTFGRNWRSTYDRYLRISAGSVVAERADGQELIFSSNGANWVSDSDTDLQLLQTGSVWTLTGTDDTIEVYTGSVREALLLSIQMRDGYMQTMAYNGSGQLLSVTDSFNRQLQFTYQNNFLQTVTAPNGLVISYGYGSSGTAPGVLDRLESVTYSTSPQTSQTYLYENPALPFALTGVIDENGSRFSTWTYDSSGRATSSQHGNGADLTSIAYNDDGSRNVTNALGLTIVYKFVVLQGVPKVVEMDRLATASVPAATIAYNYDTNGYVVSISDWKTNVTGTLNDTHDQPLILNEAVGTSLARTTFSTYLTNFHLPTIIVAPRETSTFTYDANGNPQTHTDSDTTDGTQPYSTYGQTRFWTNTFDNFGHLLSVNGPRTEIVQRTSFAYDTSNSLSSITDALGHITRLTNYNGSGLPSIMIDPNNVVTSLTYDVRNRLLTRTVFAASGNATTSFGYDFAGELTSITSPDGSFLNYRYDKAHRLQSVSNELGESIIFTRDFAGNVVAQNVFNSSGSIMKTQSHVFDELGRMLHAIGASSQTNSYAYDADGNRTTLDDGLNHNTAQAFDALNRLVSVTDPLTNITGYAYNASDNLVSVTDPRTLITTYVRDGFGRIIEEISPDKGRTIYKLDNAGNRTNETDARGVVTRRTFDALNRVTQETFPASTGENITYTYDATNGGNCGVGRLTGYTDESGSTTLRYNERGDIVSTTRTIAGTAYTTGYTYDLADHVTSIIYPSGHVIRYGRDEQGRINSVSYAPSASGKVTSLATSITYLPFGPLAGFVYGNGLSRTQLYDQDYRVRSITTASASANVQNLSLGYDAANDILSITDNLNPGRSQRFSYDPDYRLSQASGVYGPVEYSYDAVGNRLTRTAQNVTENYFYAPTANRLQSTAKANITRTFGYAANGNISTDNRGTATNLTFGYGNRNRYKTLTTGSTITATYQYNAIGERVLKTVGMAITHFHYDESGHLIAETQPSGTVVREYVWLDDMPLAQIEGTGNIYYIHPDHLGRPQKMTDVTQTVVWDNEQQPFGEAVMLTISAANLNRNGQFEMLVEGQPNYGCVIQVSTNLGNSNWVSLSTNTAPFQFTDTAISNQSAKFYRVLYQPASISTAVTQNLRFPGQYFDVESGLNYNTMRDYDPTLARYIQADPIGFMGGINIFSYSRQTPQMEIDASGLDPIGEFFGTWIGRLSGGAIGEAAEPVAGGIPGEIVGGKVGGEIGDAIGDDVIAVLKELEAEANAGLPGDANNAILSGRECGSDVSVGAAEGGTAALQPMANAALQTGTIRTVAGYELGGNAGLVGNTYNVNLWALYETEGSQGPFALMNALKSEASAAGANQISITGSAVVNQDLLNIPPAVANRLGLQFQQINPTTILLQGPIQ